MNIFDRIKQDHDAARDVIAKLKATTPRAWKTRRDLFDMLKLEMWAHHKIEEAVFYSVLRGGEHMHGEAMEAYNEHHMANGVFEELDTFPVDSEEWGMKFKALCELVEHHMDEEEKDFFPAARKVIGKDVAELMGEAFDRRKEAVLAALKPLDVERAMQAATPLASQPREPAPRWLFS
jgi:hypothetical protein